MLLIRLKKQKEDEAKIAADAKKKEEEDKAKAAASGQTTQPPAGQTGAPPPAQNTESNKQASQQSYLEGVIYYQKGDYEKARDKWLHAKQLDPGNSDAIAGLEKIEKLYGAGN